MIRWTGLALWGVEFTREGSLPYPPSNEGMSRNQVKATQELARVRRSRDRPSPKPQNPHPESRIPNPESRIPNPETRNQNSENRNPNLEPRTPNPEIQNQRAARRHGGEGRDGCQRAAGGRLGAREGGRRGTRHGHARPRSYGKAGEIFALRATKGPSCDITTPSLEPLPRFGRLLVKILK